MARSSPLSDQEPSIVSLASIPVRLRRRRRIPLLVKVVLVVAAVVGLALLFAQDQETLHIKSAVAAEDPAFPDYVASLTGSGITRGDEYQILVNGVQIFPPMLAAIRRGKYAMRAIASMSFDESIAYTESQIALLAMTEDAKEGLKAFGEKRKPSWPGK